jgi:hypothetical protein
VLILERLAAFPRLSGARLSECLAAGCAVMLSHSRLLCARRQREQLAEVNEIGRMGDACSADLRFLVTR